jgi:hypothetical protein
MRKSTAKSGSPRHPIKLQSPAKKRPQSVALPAGTLYTWKEISEYAGRGIRTLQRWEHEFGFPVQRPDPRNKSAVISSRREIDEWFRTRPLLSTGAVVPKVSGESYAKDLTASARRLELEAKRLLSSSMQMNERIRKAMELAKRRKSS